MKNTKKFQDILVESAQSRGLTFLEKRSKRVFHLWAPVVRNS